MTSRNEDEPRVDAIVHNECQIVTERDPATANAELEHQRALAQRESESTRVNPELTAILQSSAAIAVSSVNTQLAQGSARLTGPMTAAQLVSMQEANRATSAPTQSVHRQ